MSHIFKDFNNYYDLRINKHIPLRESIPDKNLDIDKGIEYFKTKDTAEFMLCVGDFYILKYGINKYVAQTGAFIRESDIEELRNSEYIKEAIYWYRKSASLNYYLAYSMLGHLYVKRIIESQSENEYLDLYKKAADLGGDKEKTDYAFFIDIKNKAESFRYFKMAKDNGYELSDLYLFMMATACDDFSYRYNLLMEGTLKKGDLCFKHLVGTKLFKNYDDLYRLTPIILPQDIIEYFEEEDPYDSYIMYDNGFYGKEDPKKAFELLNKCLEKDKQTNYVYSILGSFYILGRGTSKDPKKAIECFKKSIECSIKELDKSKSDIYKESIKSDYERIASIYLSEYKDLFLYSFYKAKSEGFSDFNAYYTACYGEYKKVTNFTTIDFDKEVIKKLTSAYNNGFIEAMKMIEKIEELDLIKINSDHFHFHIKNTFISFNNKDVIIKDKIHDFITGTLKYGCFDSDRHSIGQDQAIMFSNLRKCKNYICILTGDSLKSNWVTEEASDALKNNLNICMIIIKAKKSVFKKYVKDDDLPKEIDLLEPNNPFRIIKNNKSCSFIEYDDLIDYLDNKSNKINEVIGNFLKEANYHVLYNTYKEKTKKDRKFPIAASSSLEDNHGFLHVAKLDISSDYINRSIIDASNQKITKLNDNTTYLLVASGGEGKTLFLQKYIHERIDSDFLIDIKCKNITYDFSTLDDIIIHELNRTTNNGEATSGIIWDSDALSYFLNDENNHPLVIIDAIDELESSKIPLLFKALKGFQESNDITILLTSRPNVVSSSYIKELNIELLSILRITEDDINQIFDNIKNAQKVLIDVDKDYFFNNLNKLSDDLKYNPFYISTIILEYIITKEINTKKIDVLEQAFRLLFEELENNKLLRDNNSNISKLTWISLLCHIAYQSHFYKKIDLRKIISNYTNDDEATNTIVELLDNRDIVSSDGFTHEFFKEYLTSKYYYDDNFYEDKKIIIRDIMKLEETFINELSINNEDMTTSLQNLILYIDKRFDNIITKDDFAFLKTFLGFIIKYCDNEMVNSIINDIKDEEMYSRDIKNQVVSIKKDE